MIDEIKTCEDRTIKIEGPASSGKTQALIERCVHLLQQGVLPSEIFIEASTAFKAHDLKNRLVERARVAGNGLEEKAAQVRVCHMLEICSEILSSSQAKDFSGRDARVLNDAEYLFFIEDMRTLGQPRRRMKGMLSFFFKQWAQAKEKKDWLVGTEEVLFYEYAVKVLKLRGAMLSQEVPYLCDLFLQQDEAKVWQGRYSYVFADDFQNLSKAQQNCVCLLASKQLIVTGNVGETIEQDNEYPCPKSFETFSDLRRNVRNFKLNATFGNAKINAFCAAICSEEVGTSAANADAEKTTDVTGAASDTGEATNTDAGAANADAAGTGATDAATASANVSAAKANVATATDPANATATDNAAATGEKDILVIKWNDPNEELNGLTKYLRLMADENESYKDSTCIIVPNKFWGNALKKVLDQRGFQYSDSGISNKLAADPRDSNKCKALVAYTKLNMLANANDMVAWRSWCGFDNHLANSDAWAQLQDYCAESKISLQAGLEELTNLFNKEKKEPFPRAYVLAQRMKNGYEFIKKNKLRKGFSLLGAIGANNLAEFDAVNQVIDGDEDATELFEIVRTHFEAAHFSDATHALHIGTYENFAGLKYDNVFIFACVNGYMPTRDAFEAVSTDKKRNSILKNERHKFYCACSAARKHLVISYFSKSPLEIAEKTKMKVNRIRAEHGQRMALVGPAEFLMQTQSQQPSTIGGENLLAEYDID